MDSKILLGLIMRNIAFLIDPIDTLLPHHDSSIGMMAASLQLGCKVYFFEAQDLFLKNQQAYAHLTPLLSADLSKPIWYQQGLTSSCALAEMDVIIVRKDPPFNIDYVFMTYLLDRAEHQGVYVTNPPQALRNFNEKLVIFNFPELMPLSVVSANKEDLRKFWLAHGEIIIKPLDGMGGANVFHLKAGDVNFSVVCEVLTQHGKRPVIAQKYLPEVLTQGDRRIILFYGEPVTKVLVRTPKAGEIRANLAAGGSYAFDDLSKRDLDICAQLKPFIQKENLSLVGLDIIGGCITEINITSPTTLYELGRAVDKNLFHEYINKVLTYALNSVH